MNTVNSDKFQSTEDIALQWLVRLQSPAMSDSVEKDFFEWLNSSPENQNAFIEVESLWQRGGALSKTGREASVETEASKRFSWAGGLLGLTGVQVGAFASVFVALIALFFVNASPPSHHVDAYATTYGEFQTVELSEGSVITLNANSSVDVSLSSKGSREVTLNNGEVFFDVAPDKSRPFTIQTEDGLVVVLGTQFSVSNKDGKTQITVVEGKVGLLPGETDWHGQSSAVVLGANQQVVLAPSVLDIHSVDANKALSWRKGQLHFEGEPLQKVVDALNRYYNTSLKLADKELESQMVVAVFPLKNDFESNLKHLKQSLQLKTVIAQNGDILLGLE